jgi:hypothetical protein
VQAGPQRHVSPHAQPARRLVAVAWQPHPQVVAEQDLHEQAFVIAVM